MEPEHETSGHRGKVLAVVCVMLSVIGCFLVFCAIILDWFAWRSDEFGIFIYLNLARIAGLVAVSTHLIVVPLACIHLVRKMQYRGICLAGIALTVMSLVVLFLSGLPATWFPE